MLLLKFYCKWRWPLRLKFVRNQRERLNPNNALGAPLTNDKIKYFLNRKISLKGMLTKLLYPPPRKTKTFPCSQASMRIRNAALNARMNLSGIKPRMPAGKFVITLAGMRDSRHAAERCIASAKLHGEDHNLEIFPAIDRFQAESYFKQHQLSWTSRSKDNIRQAAMGCFASHFSLWLKAMELNKPIIILEHDAVFASKIPALQFKHIAFLAYSDI